MKHKVLLTTLIAFSLFSCNHEKRPAVSTQTGLHDEHAGGAKTEASALTLNNGGKWQADERTQFHAANLNALVERFSKKAHADYEAYQVFAADIQNELAGLVKDCKMKGADHDALHLWLEPVMKDANALEKAATASDGKIIAGRLITNIQKFNQYFENGH
jgi:hypothetical protein